MKKNIFVLSAISIAFLISCNNSGKKVDPLQAKADSLESSVLEVHNVAMPKSMKIPKAQKEIQRLIDSIDKLPVKQKQTASSYKESLEALFKNLDDAHAAMEKWMTEFNLDSFKNNNEQHIKYLSEEKIKVDKVKDALLSSLQKVDSVLKH